MNLNPFKSPSYTNPADQAMPYLNQIPGTISPYYQPYIDQGQQSLSQLMGQYNTLLNDPGSTMNMLGSGYQQSPGYQYQMNQGMNAVNSAAAAGGMAGTPSHQQYAGQMATDLASQDFNNYLSKVMGLFGQGLQGMQGINQMGYGASNELAQSLGNNLMNQGNLAYAGQANQNQANADKYNRNVGLATGLVSGAAGFF